MKYQLNKLTTAITATVLGVAMSSVNADAMNSANQAQLVPVVDLEASKAVQRYIVKYKNQSAGIMSDSEAFDSVSAHNLLENHGAKVKLELAAQGAIAAEMSLKAVEELRNNPNVEYVELDQKRYLMSAYNDDVGNPVTTQLRPYSIYQSQANQLTLKPGMKVCVIDSGIAGATGETGGKNNDFNWSAITGDNDSKSGNWNEDGGPHGTHVAGTIGAADNGFGVVGMAPGVPMHIIKVFKKAGWTYSSNLAHAANLCANAGAKIINMSLGGGAANTTDENAFKAFTNNGGLVLAAAGNDGNTVRSFPAGYKSVMMIGGNDSDNKHYTSSQHPNCTKDGVTDDGHCVEVTAGGVDVLSTYPSGGATISSLSAGGTAYPSKAMENKGNASGSTFFMGTAESTNSGANGKICVIDRGAISFHDKVKNCQNSGGIGAIIINNVAGVLQGTLGSSNTTTIPAVGAAFENRAAIMGASSAVVNIAAGDYGYMSGTSMATPGVAGIAALVWSNHPSCTGTQIRNVLKATAADAGVAGKDDKFGYGIVKAKAASDYITAKGCDGTGGNVAPTAAFTHSCTNLACTFDGSSSTDSDGSIASYAWNFGDGNNGTGANASHTYSAANTYTVKLTVTDNKGGTNTISKSVTVTAASGGANELTNGVAKTGLAASKGNTLAYTLDVPAGASGLKFEMSGGTGDADMYVKFGSAPTTSSYDCRPYKTGNAETCNISSAKAGKYHVMVRAYSTFSGVSLKGSYTEAGAGGTASKTNLSGATGSWKHYTLAVPAGMSSLSVKMSGGTGDADLYVRKGSQPTTSSYDCRPYKTGNTETCTISNPAAATWYLSIRAYSAYTGVNLNAEWK